MHCGGAVGGAASRPSSALVSPFEALREQLVSATRGEYHILAELGRGGMAAVYLAEEISLGRRVAVKVMVPGLDAGEGMADRFLLEARTAAQLSHPNIIPIYAVRTTDQLRYFVMKYIGGRSLDRILAETGPLPVPVVLAILAQIGAALEHAHRRGVVHRDIKPANIILDEDGAAIVADFGIAKVSQGVSLTQTGSTVGTPTYMSPEQCTGKTVTGASDQYALGCVAFELLAGRPPFAHQEVVPVLLAHVSDAPPPLLPLRTDCPLELAVVIDKMLAKNPGDRWDSLDEAVAAAEAAPFGADPGVRAVMRNLGGAGTVAPANGTTPALMEARARVRAERDHHATEASIGIRDSAGQLEVLPGGGALAVGQVVQLAAVWRSGTGEARPAANATWSSSDLTILRVTAEGELTGFRPGSARIRVACGGETREVAFQVSRVEVATVRIHPRPAMVEVGEVVRLQAEGGDRFGSILAGRVVTWASTHPGIIAVSPDGLLRGLAPGQARVSAVVGGGLAGLDVRVAPINVAGVRLEPSGVTLRVGESGQLRALVQGRRNGPLDGVPIQWQSSDPNVARVSPDGVVTGLRFGTARIAATAGGCRATMAVEVRAGAAGFTPRPWSGG